MRKDKRVCKNHPQPQNRQKKFDQNRQPHAKQSKPIIVHIPVRKTLIDPIRCWHVEQFLQRFRGYSRSVEEHNGHLDRRENGIQIGQSENFIVNQIRSPLDRFFWVKNRKPHAKERKIRKLQRTPNPKNRHSLAQKPILKRYRKSQWPFKDEPVSSVHKSHKW